MQKLITHAASVIAQKKGDRIRVFVRGTLLKSKQHSPPVNLLASSTNKPTTCLEMQLRTAQSNHTQGYVVHFRKNHHRLLLGNWNVLTFTEKELKLIEEAKKYHLDIVEVFSTAR